MNRFEYFLTLLTVISGLIITEVLSNLVSLIKAGDHVTQYWLPYCWGILLLLLVLQWCWNFRTWEEIFITRRFNNYFHLLLMLSGPVSLYCTARFLFPDVDRTKIVDLKSYYFANHAWFATSGAVAIFMFILWDWLFVEGLRILDRRNLIRIPSVLSLVACALWTAECLHVACWTANAILLILFLCFESPPLRVADRGRVRS